MRRSKTYFSMPISVAVFGAAGVAQANSRVQLMA